MNKHIMIGMALAAAAFGGISQAQQPDKDALTLLVHGAPASGIIWQLAPRAVAPGSAVEFSAAGHRLVGQHIPSSRHHGWLTALLPPELVAQSQRESLELHIAMTPGLPKTPELRQQVAISMPAYALSMRADRQGGFPSRIQFPSGRVLEAMLWGDRVYDGNTNETNEPHSGEWHLSLDPTPALAIIADGPICTVVSQTAHFSRKNGQRPPNAPAATYQWVFFKEPTGLIYVEADYRQNDPHGWDQLHFAEWHIDDGSFSDWYGCNQNTDAVTSGKIKEKKDILVFTAWAALAEGNDFIAVHDTDTRMYTDFENKRSYLHAAQRWGWGRWDQASANNATWLQIGTAADNVPTSAKNLANSLTPKLARWHNSDPDWRQATANAARCYGRDNATRKTIERESADLALVLAHIENAGGQSLCIDAVAQKSDGLLIMEQSQPVFHLTIQKRQDQSTHELSSMTPWQHIEINDGELLFRGPLTIAGAETLSVRVLLDATADQPGLSWRLEFIPGSDAWRAQTARVGTLSLEPMGSASHALVPGGEGSVVHSPFASRLQVAMVYPSLNATMGFMAVWDDQRGSGLYFAAHDPSGAYKRMIMRNPGGSSQLQLDFEHRLPFWPDDPSRTISTPGTVVWQSFQGDWYQATKIYRDWVRENASWYPPMGPDGRRTTPLWLKQLCIWARVFGEANTVVPQAVKFHDTMGVPCGFHWYQWHQIPFDNDYPHYLPARDGFADGVKAIQAMGCYAMPYTNGRLWDTRDRDAEDWQFTSVGKAGASKRADGAVVTESYHSKESDGSKVILAVMCPASKTWKDKITENDQNLANDYGLNGVYMDQIAASASTLCEDSSHGHPLGGGDWWVAGYKNILQDVRKIIPKDRILASECNAETYVDLLDAMVCWHIEGENVVPAYSMIYSGVVFRYGRAYDGNARAMRMKWANNLVNGDTPGWFPPTFMDKPEMRDYLVPLVHFRLHAIRYFYTGELSRPPALRDKVHAWAENWNIFGRFSINSLPCVQSALRRIVNYDYDADGRRLWASGKVQSALLICTNFSDEEARSALTIDWQELGIDPANARGERLAADGTRTPFDLALLNQPMLFPAATTWGVEIFPKNP